MIKFLIRILNRLKLINRFNFYPSVSINGTQLIVPIIRGMGQSNLSISEFWMCELLKNIMNLKEGVFIDIGVNMGQTLLKLKTVNTKIKYIGFEPNPTCVFYTNEIIKANNYQDTIIIPVGIAEKNLITELNFIAQSDTDSSASIVKNFRPNIPVVRKEYISCFSFENIQTELKLKEVSILKIDVEGSEANVIRGALTIIKTMRPFILVEILPVYQLENKERLHNQNEIENSLKELDYKIYRIHKTFENKLAKLELLCEIGIHSSIELSDYLLCPAELSDNIKKWQTKF